MGEAPSGHEGRHVHLMVGREGDLEDKSRSSDVRWRVSSPMRAFLQHEFAQVVLKTLFRFASLQRKPSAPTDDGRKTIIHTFSAWPPVPLVAHSSSAERPSEIAATLSVDAGLLTCRDLLTLHRGRRGLTSAASRHRRLVSGILDAAEDNLPSLRHKFLSTAVEFKQFGLLSQLRMAATAAACRLLTTQTDTRHHVSVLVSLSPRQT